MCAIGRGWPGQGGSFACPVAFTDGGAVQARRLVVWQLSRHIVVVGGIRVLSPLLILAGLGAVAVQAVGVNCVGSARLATSGPVTARPGPGNCQRYRHLP